jgi:hypothetical protein
MFLRKPYAIINVRLLLQRLVKLLFIATQRAFEAGNLTWNATSGPISGRQYALMNVLSAFAPFEGDGSWFSAIGGERRNTVDLYNNWPVMLPPEYSEYYEYEESSFTGWWMRTRQLWVQTSNESLVCILGNASYDVDFEFVNGVLVSSK